MQSDLEIRAKKAAVRFNDDAARRPIVIEFAGVPKAGKTSTLNYVQSFLKRCGFRTEVVMERASICPVRDKKHPNFNVWTACTTLAQILEKTQEPPKEDDPHILILDRGLFDTIVWFKIMQNLSRLTKNQRDVMQKFFLLPEWRKRISAVVFMVVDPKDALERERGLLPVEGSLGSIMNEQVLQQMRTTSLEVAEELKGMFNITVVDTSEIKDIAAVARKVANHVVEAIEADLSEDVLVLSRADITGIFSGTQSITHGQASALVDAYRTSGSYLPRDQAENDRGQVQALPVVIVRNASGAVLKLKRREKDPSNTLNEKFVIWAGGHVRKEDASDDANPILACAVRELQEELRLGIREDELKLLGAVYADTGGKTSLHLAIVYEWQSPSDDLAIALSRTEFYERRGTSQSGTFVSIEEIVSDINSKKISEPWSLEMIKFLSPSLNSAQPGLF